MRGSAWLEQGAVFPRCLAIPGVEIRVRKAQPGVEILSG
jgi:hypothetical protein